jgi:NTE family protein
MDSHEASMPPSPARRRLARALLAGGALAPAWLGGCAAFDYRAPDAPEPLATLAPLQPRPRLALVLGSGGPRGYAHLGVLRVLEDAGIRPDLVVGSSVGALIGTFWASGLSAAELDARSFEGGPFTVFDPWPFADRGWIIGQRLQDYVNTGVQGRALEQLPRRVVVAFFARGNAGVAVRASGAVPGIVSPVGIGGVDYEDGDESLPLPVSAARAAGAGWVIAVDVTVRPGATPARATPAQRDRDRRRRARIEPEVALADFVLHPDLAYDAGPWRSYFVDSRRRGEAHARERLPALLAALPAALRPA